MKDLFVWQLWVGMLLGYFLLGRIIQFVKSKTASLTS